MLHNTKSHAGQLAALKLRYSVLRELHTTILERLATTERELQEKKTEIDDRDIDELRRFLAVPATRTGPQARNMERSAYDLANAAFLLEMEQRISHLDLVINLVGSMKVTIQSSRRRLDEAFTKLSPICIAVENQPVLQKTVQAAAVVNTRSLFDLLENVVNGVGGTMVAVVKEKFIVKMSFAVFPEAV